MAYIVDGILVWSLDYQHSYFLIQNINLQVMTVPNLPAVLVSELA